MNTLGIDVGGTHTDVVLINSHHHIIASAKVLTTSPPDKGIADGITQVLSSVNSSSIQHIHIGTTHALNALLNIDSLLPVGVLRIAGQKANIPAGMRWNAKLREAVVCGLETIGGGFECHGEPISSFCTKELHSSVLRLLEKGAKGFAIISCFGSLFPEHEIAAYQYLREMVGQKIPITVSSSIGSIGFLERENATILNTALHQVIGQSFSSIELVTKQLGISACITFVQNDGSQMTINEAMKKPICTLSCGPINSAKGGVFLSKHQSCIVVDIGGTSTDVAAVHKMFVKRSSGVLTIADVRMRFPSPDVVSLPIGGGSIVNQKNKSFEQKSVGRHLFTRGQAFGGDILTATDLAILTQFVAIEGSDSSLIRCTKEEALAILTSESARIAHAIRLVRGEDKHLPCVLVGGGAAIFQHILQKQVEGIITIDDPQQCAIANALGSAFSEISGRFEGIIDITDRQKSIEYSIHKAKEDAVLKGACLDTVRIGELSIEPIAYTTEKRAKVTVSVLGPAKKNSR